MQRTFPIKDDHKIGPRATTKWPEGDHKIGPKLTTKLARRRPQNFGPKTTTKCWPIFSSWEEEFDQRTAGYHHQNQRGQRA